MVRVSDISDRNVANLFLQCNPSGRERKYLQFFHGGRLLTEVCSVFPRFSLVCVFFIHAEREKMFSDNQTILFCKLFILAQYLTLPPFNFFKIRSLSSPQALRIYSRLQLKYTKLSPSTRKESMRIHGDDAQRHKLEDILG